MTSNSLQKYLSVANELLECALILFVQGRFFSAIHLAGAAEELFGKMVENRKKPSESVSGDGENCRKRIVPAHVEQVELIRRLKGAGSEKRALKAISDHLNLPKNAVKHLKEEGDAALDFDPKEAAQEKIEGAVLNFRRLTGGFPETEAYERFWCQRRSS